LRGKNVKAKEKQEKSIKDEATPDVTYKGIGKEEKQ